MRGGLGDGGGGTRCQAGQRQTHNLIFSANLQPPPSKHHGGNDIKTHTRNLCKVGDVRNPSPQKQRVKTLFPFRAALEGTAGRDSSAEG